MRADRFAGRLVSALARTDPEQPHRIEQPPARPRRGAVNKGGGVGRVVTALSREDPARDDAARDDPAP